MQFGKNPRDNTFLSQQQFPRIDFHQIAGPKWQHDEQVEYCFPFSFRIACRKVGERIGDDGGCDGDHCRHGKCAQDDIEVCGLEELRQGAECWFINNSAGKLVY